MSNGPPGLRRLTITLAEDADGGVITAHEDEVPIDRLGVVDPSSARNGHAPPEVLRRLEEREASWYTK
jgi:hypothetical protein